ncbi:hypothetical protein [Streptomyces sp. 8P21H-1]|uniref:hypothetical protein n=1 Tax=Streptomyces sp. 8P21H-1 TaxID=2737048 RepID=UPI0020C697A8|nr:hypothetical protein [Streptomyces sp. 8P21H-1]
MTLGEKSGRLIGVWHDRAVSDARLLAVEAVESHVRAFFEGHSVEVVVCDLGSERREVLPDLRVLVVGPGPRSDSWAYVTAGCWAAMEKDGHGLEFVMTTHVRDQRFIDLGHSADFAARRPQRAQFRTCHRSYSSGVIAQPSGVSRTRMGCRAARMIGTSSPAARWAGRF